MTPAGEGGTLPKCPKMLLNALEIVRVPFLSFFFPVLHRLAFDPATAGGSRCLRSYFQIRGAYT